MGLDIRLPIGALFALLGFVLAAFGLVSDKDLYQRSLGGWIRAAANRPALDATERRELRTDGDHKVCLAST